MRFRVRSTVYDELWKNGKSVELSKMAGLHHVEVCTGLIPNFRKWRKLISEGKSVRTHAFYGHNLKGESDRAFGDFTLRQEDRGDGVQMVTLVYNDHDVVDYLVKIGPGLYLGKFTWRGRFLAYFWLLRDGGVPTL